MADNPFYLGYKQDPKFEEPSKLYPGYFPGRPQPRPPLPRDFLGPTPDFGSVADEFGSVAFGVAGNMENFPRFVQEKIWDDFVQTLTPSIRPGDVSPEHLDDFDADTLPGAFGLSAGNPIDWITDPSKTLDKTLKSWRGTLFSWNDLDTRARTHLWDQVLTDNPKYEFAGEAMAAAVLMDRTGRPYRVSASGANPFALRDSRIYGIAETKKKTTLNLGVDAAGNTIVKTRKTGEQIDVYDKVADSVITFQRKSVSASSRESSYDDFVRDALDAVDVELNLTGNRAIIAADPNKLNALDSFSRRRAIAKDMQNIDFSYGGKFQLSSSMEKFALEGGGATTTVTINGTSYTGNANVLSIHQKSASFDKKIQEALDTLDKELGTGGIGVAGFLDSIDPEEAARLRKFTQPYRKHLKDLQTANKQLLDAAQAGTLTRAQAITFYNRLDRVAKGGLKGRGASGGDLLVQGFEREMIRDMMDKEFMLPRSKGSHTRIGDVVDGMGPTVYAKKLRPIAARLKYEREIYAIDEFVANVEKGRLIEVYVWRRMKNWMTGLTPDFYSKHVMKKLNYFGLIIDKDNTEAFKNSFAYKASRGFGIGAIGAGGAPGRLFGNWFSVEHTGITDPRRRGFDPMMAGVRLSGNAWGGGHFEGVQGLHLIRSLVTKGEWTPGGIMYLLQNARTGCFDDPNFIRLLRAANGGKPITLPDGIKLDKFADQIVKFRDWVTANKDNFKVNGVAANVSDHVFWFALLDSLMKRERSGEAISMTRTFAGLLEKVWSNFNQLQTWILKKFGKYLAPLSYAKTIISEFIADLIPRLFSMIAGAVSGGVLSVAIEALGRALRPIIRYTVKKVLDFGQNFVGGLLHGDFYKAFAELEKQVVGFIRFATGVAAVPFFVIIFLSSGFFGSTLTTISPVDISKAEPFIPEGSANCTAPGNSCVISGGVDFCCPGSVCKNNVCFFCKGDGLPSLDDCSNCCSGICTGSPGSKVCTGDANRPPPPCEGCTAPPPAGNFGDGTNCLEGEFPVQCSLGNKGLEHPCIHPPHNGYAVDLQAPYDTPLFAPYDGESSPYNDGPEYGGSAIIFFPLDPSGDYQDDITSDCPAFYFSHMSYDGLVSGMVTKGTRIGLVSDTGNATGLPHAHTSADTDGAFPSGVGDVNINDLFHSWDPGNVKGYHCTTPWNPGADITCP